MADRDVVMGRRRSVVGARVVVVALIAAVLGMAPALVASRGIGADPAPDTTPVTGVQDVPDVGRTPETATLVANGTTIRSILDPNRGLDRWFAIDLSAGDGLSVGVDAEAPGMVALSSVPGGADPSLGPIGSEPPGTAVDQAGRYLVRYQGQPGTQATRYAVSFVVTASPTPRATLPPEGVLVCGAADLSGLAATEPPGTRLCPGAIVTSELSGTHPWDIFAIEMAWGEELSVATTGSAVTLTFAYPSDVTSSGPVWYPLPARQTISETGTFLVRASLPAGAGRTPYTATFDVLPADAGQYALVSDIELAPGCVILSAGEPLGGLPVQDGESVLLRVTDTDPAPQDLVLGPVDALTAGLLDGLARVGARLGATTAFTWPVATGGAPWAFGCLDATGAIRSVVPLAAPASLVAVPDLAGLTLGQAARALADAGLAGSSPRVVNDTAPEGTVVRTDPPAGSQVAPGTPVTIYLSDGNPPVVTPSPAPVATPAPTAPPIATPAPTPTPPPAATPAPQVATPPPVTSQASPRAPEPTAFSCEGRTVVADPLGRAWRVTQMFWALRDSYDRVTLRLQPDPGRRGGRSRAIAETFSPAELAAALPGVEVRGDTAVVIRFLGPVSLPGEMAGTPGFRALQSAVVTRDDRGRVWAVFGVAGGSCVALTSTAWADPSTQTTPFVDITLDIRH